MVCISWQLQEVLQEDTKHDDLFEDYKLAAWVTDFVLLEIHASQDLKLLKLDNSRAGHPSLLSTTLIAQQNELYES